MKSKKSRNMLFLTLSAVLLVVLALTGCGSNNNGNNAPSSAPSNNAANGGSSANTGSDLLNEIKTAGVIKVGLMGTYAPYNFLNENKEIDGFDADVAKEVAKRLGVKVEFAPQEFSGLIPSLQAGKIDAIISQVTITDERKQQIDFTQPYITNEVKIIVKEDNDSITKLEDFKGKNIGVGLGTNDESYLRNDVLPQVGNFEIKTYDDVITSLQDLNAGRIDATINNLYALKPIVDKNGYKIKAVGDAIKSDQAGIAIRKNNPEFLAALDQALTDMKADGTYNTIFQKWFGEEPPAE
ncbi:transporter substrate-binding domain-containing protein [Paenibacillus phoenicis]|uniref:Transporter substrate-binding domain-containing protein n=1 Tax=Paenibacillus phoenicis TaxID=554117 RepID=A0ABU5PKP6_9BACL|nr:MULTISPECIES: transporter substrate-binding domain-containing protein [Paenibacillus]MCT2197027.1 transporter substrate-binding domain-containing protein [Paenibacillus sp. p3-SID1389]MEA3570498.1 transporter substrate-binding domain-containing protein [Paenibacillus phoenicis]MEC2343476.1 transporter substrate-binding domain-containing protein [Paenibacillus barengoltzii]